ncbi:MAG: ankyrin repeat domain-containing protein [Sphingorhabdus sp.]|uniref:ankyrin repeat domain-containing protein n=1 Tax=Sphingorhabdus sp. TaxID=1902408 RepID=UPI003CBD3048
MDEKDKELLIRAIVSSDDLFVKRWIDAGNPVDFYDREHRSPLHYAVQYKNSGIVKSLLDCDVDLEVKDRNGNTPLSDSIFYSGGNKTIIKMLLSKGADQNNENNYGVSPLSLAKSVGNFDFSDCFDF